MKTGPEKGKCLMGKIRSDTRFEAPLKDMFKSLDKCTVGSGNIGIGIWFSMKERVQILMSLLLQKMHILMKLVVVWC